MKKNLLSLLSLASVISVSAQTPNANHKAYYTIPTVVHLVNTTDNNWDGHIIPLNEEQVRTGIELINQGLRGELARTRINQIMFSSRDKIAGLDIELKLVNRNTAGAASTGVIYEANDIRGGYMNNFTDGVYNFQSYSRETNWDPTRYFNIYIVNHTAGGPSGVAFRPDEINDTIFSQGMFINYLSWPIGDLSTGMSQGWGSEANNLRFKYFGIGAHEVGHFLNLIHTFGSQNGGHNDCGAARLLNDDSVADTPKTSNGGEGLGIDPLEASRTFACDGTTRIMRDNLMNYSNHIVMFTPNQVARMEAALNSDAADRNNLWTNENLIRVGLKTANDDRYCYAKGKTTPTVADLREWISNVTLTPTTVGAAAIINQNSVVPADVNSYYTINRPANVATTPNVVQGRSYNLSVRLNNIWDVTNEHTFAVTWIDWNNNGLFEDSERTVLRTNGSNRDALVGDNAGNTAIATITVPAGATINQNTRMRVRSIYNGNSELAYVVPAVDRTRAIPDATVNNDNIVKTDMVLESAYSCTPCGDGLYGEVEDYVLNVTAQPVLSTGIVEQESKELKVATNNDTLSVIYGGNDTVTAIEITDLTGKTIQQVAATSNTVTSDISNLVTGTYVVKTTTNKAAYSNKFIKK